MQETAQASLSRKRKARKGMRVTLLVLAALVLAAVGTVSWLLRRGLPQTTGTLALEGLLAPVTVTRDAEGVPHIAAENHHDLFLAQGYVQAQDRMFQMDLSRRQASGRLSEVFGTQAVENDKFFRTLGLRRAAEASWDGYTQEVKDILDWYSQGVNAYLAHMASAQPVEFLLNGYTPEPWTPLDCLTIGKYMAYDLGGHWRDVAFRQYLLDHFPREEALELFPEGTYPTGAPLIIPDASARVSPLFLAEQVQPDVWNGSNNWVVAGEKTASGLPLLSNDPHLSIASPSVWYQMHLVGGDYDVSGVIFAGAPGIIVGHNRHVAWGVTNTGPDVQDLFIEKINPDNPRQYLHNDAWVDMVVYQEDIRVKGGTVVPYEVLATRHGPVISDLAASAQADTVYAMQWTALEPSLELEGMLGLDTATDWPSFEKALEKFHAPTQNFVFACVDGTIAYKANGKIPVRAQGDGLLPAPGWTDAYDWVGYIPFDALPRVVNPPAGFIATANHKVIGDDYPYHISHNWAQPYRQERIVEVLADAQGLTVADMQALQADVLDLHAREMVPLMTQALADAALTPRQQDALALLADWDCQTTEEAAAPLVFNLWFSRVTEVIFEDRFSEEGQALFGSRAYITDGLLRRAQAGTASAWLDHQGGLTQVLLRALDRALDQIETAQGKDMAKWRWGAFHQVAFVHPLSSVGFLKPIFNPEGSKPSPGSSTTVRAAGWNASGVNNHGASWRFVRGLAEPSFAYHIVAPGQSGHPLSASYHKQFDRWIAGEQYQTFVEGYTGDVLTLAPKP